MRYPDSRVVRLSLVTIVCHGSLATMFATLAGLRRKSLVRQLNALSELEAHWNHPAAFANESFSGLNFLASLDVYLWAGCGPV
jgi:hypothetical protein